MIPSEGENLFMDGEGDVEYGEAITEVVTHLIEAAQILHEKGEGPPVRDATRSALVMAGYDTFTMFAAQSVKDGYVPSDSEVIMHDLERELERGLDDDS